MSDFPMYGRGPEWIPVRQSPALQGEGYRMFMVSRTEPDRMAVAYLRAGRTWFYDAAGAQPLGWEPQWFGEAPCWPPLPAPPGWDDSRVGWRKVIADGQATISVVREGDRIEAIVMKADLITSDGALYPVEEVRKLADNKTLFFDEERKALVYRGPAPRA